jgi:hypothetical protein
MIYKISLLINKNVHGNFAGLNLFDMENIFSLFYY